MRITPKQLLVMLRRAERETSPIGRCDPSEVMRILDAMEEEDLAECVGLLNQMENRFHAASMKAWFVQFLGSGGPSRKEPPSR